MNALGILILIVRIAIFLGLAYVVVLAWIAVVRLLRAVIRSY